MTTTHSDRDLTDSELVDLAEKHVARIRALTAEMERRTTEPEPEPVEYDGDEGQEPLVERFVRKSAEAHVKPSRDGIARTIWDCTNLHRAILEDCEEIADAVLALWPGKTEQEVRVDERQKVAMEVRKSANLLHPDAVENGAVTIDSLIGFINDLAARIARGGEGR